MDAMSGMSFAAVAVTVVVALGAHFWTAHVHATSLSPNWTLLQILNVLSLLGFATSIYHLLFKQSAGPSPQDDEMYFVWCTMCVLCVVYFFSIF